jgi:hypothetical protein
MLLAKILTAINDPMNRAIHSAFLSLLFKQTPPGVIDLDCFLSRLKREMSYMEVDLLAFHLSLQMRTLEEHGQTLLFWQPSDILVVEFSEKAEKLYILANLSQQVPLDKKDETQLCLVYPTTYPFPQERCAPELLKMTALPFRTQRSASYYSLALLCLDQLKLPLDQIKDTKLFYFLERCLKLKPSERVCLYL